jgi:TolB-like protein/Tfp pilus assembly protein PilF
MANRDPRRFWDELLRRRVVRAAVFYAAGAWVLAQAFDLMLDAFDASQYMRFVVAGLVLGLPVATVLAWMFDITPQGIERTQALPEAVAAPPAQPPPERSIAVLPFANLSQEVENEYFSDGLSEEIRNQLAREAGLRVAARSSSFAFKGRHEDVREIGRRLNVATVLEGGVRKHADTVRIDVQLVNTTDGYQVWAQTFERRLGDIFQLQSEVACAVITAIRPQDAPAVPPPALVPATQDFDAYNLYLLGRHYFHKRTAAALGRAVECFEQAIARDPDYALAYSGLADAHILLSAGYYGDMSVTRAIARALPAATRAVELAPGLAEAHTSLGLIRHSEGDYAAAEAAFERALALNAGYAMAHIWHGLVLTAQGRYREAAARNREAFRLDPLSPIINTNVGFDALRFGDEQEALARFAAAIEIDPAFPVPYSGMARLNGMRGSLHEARRWIERAMERAPARAFYLARNGLFLLQLGETDAAVAAIDAASSGSPDNAFDVDLAVAALIVREDREALARVATGEPGRAYAAAQRAQAHLALGNQAEARELYEANPPDLRQEVQDVINDEWVWRLPHVVNHAHLRLVAGDDRGRLQLEQLLAHLEELWSQGIVNVETLYWAVGAEAVLGRHEQALARLEAAIRRGWRHAWWARRDWNLRGLAGDPRYGELLARGAVSADT